MIGSQKIIRKIKQLRMIAEFLEDVNRLQRLRVYTPK
jgi:hypothetical protein